MIHELKIVVALALLSGTLIAPEVALAQDESESDDSPEVVLPRPGGRSPLRPMSPGGRRGLPDDMPTRPPLPTDGSDGGDSSSSEGRSGGGDSVGTSSKTGDDAPPVNADGDPQIPPKVQGASLVSVDMANTNVYALVKYYAEITGRNAIIGDIKELKGKEVSIISYKKVSVPAAEQAIISALEVAGYTLVINGSTVQVVQTKEAISKPIQVGVGESIPYSDKFVTQLIPLENVNGSDISTIVNTLVSSEGKVLNYAPTNTLIITESANNLRRVYKIIKELDIAAPKSKISVLALDYAEATAIKTIIDELYEVGQESASSTSRKTTKPRSSSRRPKRDKTTEKSAEAVSAGQKSKYISKVIADERTNSLIVLANDEGLAAILKLISEIDVDVDLTSRSQVQVVYLENAKAEDVASVLANLSESGSSSSSSKRPKSTKSSKSPKTGKSLDSKGDESTGVIAAFDSGMRITHDEDTNSLIVIASNDDFKIIKRVIDKLDVERRQVFVDAVVLEMSSDDSAELGFAFHGPLAGESEEGMTFGGAQLGASSLGLSQDMLTGLALGAFGESISVPFADGTSIDIPAFGVVLNALKSNSSVNIISNPNVTTLDNEEAEITVGRKIPFPTSQSMNSLGQPVISYQREDVAITLKVTPRINSSDAVTLEIHLEVAEVEEDNSGLDPNQAGFITSKREVKTFALVLDNQTVVLGGLMGTTDTEVETKIPILGDLPLIGALFRGSRDSSRKTNLMVFMTPHIIDDEWDMQEIMEVKEAQRQEFLRRFYGRSRDEQVAEMRRLLGYSMNNVGEKKHYRDERVPEVIELEGVPVSEETKAAIEAELDAAEAPTFGEDAGELPTDTEALELENDESAVDDDLAGTGE